jgi:peroxiredoxin Q/BCP
MMLKSGDKAPQFSGPDQHGTSRSLRDFRGRKLLLYFYPKDMTGGCTQEACDFRDNMARLEAHGAAVVGVSPDPVRSHARFAEKESLPFPLISDEDRSIVETYGVWKEKTLYGRKYMGVERTTFLIDEKGRIQKVFPKVKVKGHVDEIIRELER